MKEKGGGRVAAPSGVCCHGSCWRSPSQMERLAPHAEIYGCEVGTRSGMPVQTEGPFFFSLKDLEGNLIKKKMCEYFFLNLIFH